MELNQILAIFDREQRQEVTYPGEPREVTPEVVRLLSPHRRVSSLIYSELNESNADMIIRREVTYATGLGHNLSWKVYTHDQPPNLKQRLAAHGFAAQDLESVLVLDLQENGRPLMDEGLLSGVDMRRITGPETIGAVITIEEDVWDEDQSYLQDLAVELQTAPQGLSMYAAYVDGVPASAAWIRFHAGSQFASLWRWFHPRRVPWARPLHRPAGPACSGSCSAWCAFPDDRRQPHEPSDCRKTRVSVDHICPGL